MQAFIAGATGYTGQAVVAELLRLGHAPIAHAREASAPNLQDRFPDLTIDTSPWPPGHTMELNSSGAPSSASL